MPLALPDSELAAVMEAARPVPPHQRSAFLTDVATELARYEIVGDGVIHRVVRAVQREHMTRPRKGNHVGSKWGH